VISIAHHSHNLNPTISSLYIPGEHPHLQDHELRPVFRYPLRLAIPDPCNHDTEAAHSLEAVLPVAMLVLRGQSPPANVNILSGVDSRRSQELHIDVVITQGVTKWLHHDAGR
jgi:hypothetical protein